MQDLAEELKEYLLDKGASLVGIADLSELEDSPFKDLTRAVSIAVALDPEIVAGISDGPTEAYYHEYERVNERLNELCGDASRFLTGRGFTVKGLPATGMDFDEETLSATFPHKTAATRAGLGWIGKNDLLVTREFGSAVRLCSIFTDALLRADVPITESLCGTCRECVRACPASAPSGEAWSPGLHRDSFIDIRSCHDKLEEFAGEKDFEHLICGICISVCPWTRKYLKRKGTLP